MIATTITLDLGDALALRDAAKLALRQEILIRHDSSFARLEIPRLINGLRAIRAAIHPCS